MDELVKFLKEALDDGLDIIVGKVDNGLSIGANYHAIEIDHGKTEIVADMIEELDE